MLYQKLLKPVLFKFDPEAVHNFFVDFGQLLGRCFCLRKIIWLFYGYRGKNISKKVDGLTFKTPFLLSAGFDYNGRLINILPEIAFGGVEVGSVTARPCPGNDKPRLRRLPKSQSLLVNKGLRNDGVDKIIKRIKSYKKPKDFIVGISIARTNDAESASNEAGLADYLYSFKRLNEENVGDYYAINISCPNAFGGETFTNPKLLVLLLDQLKTVKCAKPVYVKMPISLPWSDFNEILKILERYEMIKGVIIGNLNKDYNSVDFKEELPPSNKYCGGLSGKPCFETSNRLIRETRKIYGQRFTIIGCGGVMSPDNMIEKFKAGSDLVALITGMIYNGPGFIKTLSQHYSKNI